jgi:Ca2+-binding EF-hand superfamily protein
LRGQGVQNYWVLVTAQRESDDFDENQMDKPVKVSDILSVIAQFLRNKGPYGLKGLRRMFARIDEGCQGSLERDDLKWSLQNYGIVLADDELKTLIQSFDKDGRMDYNMLLSAIDVKFLWFPVKIRIELHH